MIFALVKISSSRPRNYSYAYQSVIMEMGASTKWINHFGSEDEMIAVVKCLLAKQNQGDQIRRVVDHIRHGDYYFFDLDLTAKEAESLGWKKSQIDRRVL